MSKHITLENLNVVLPPFKHLIDKKAESIDWNENDPAASGYIKNRPFYTDKKIIDIIPQTTVEFNDNWTYYEGTYPSLVDGEIYTVVLDGEQYNCKASGFSEVYEGEKYEWWCLGNSSIVGDGPDTGEPFFMYVDDLCFECCIPVDETWECDIRVFGPNITIHKISSEYLPEIKVGEGAEIGIKGTGMNAEVFNNNAAFYASGNNSHAEGFGSTASGYCSHAEGNSTIAREEYSHAEGLESKAFGRASHAEGDGTIAQGEYSHAEGLGSTASGYSSHAEGGHTIASGTYSHTEGRSTTASNYYSHAEGEGTIASSHNQHVQGAYNIEDSLTEYLHIVGNGTEKIEGGVSNITRSNAHTLDWNGNAWFQGDVYTGSTSGTNRDDGSKKLATEEYVNNALAGFTPDSTIPTQMVLADQVTGEHYVICIQNGNLVTYKAES